MATTSLTAKRRRFNLATKILVLLAALVQGTLQPLSLVKAQHQQRSPGPRPIDKSTGWPMPGHDARNSSAEPDAGPSALHLLFSRPHFTLRAVGPDGHIFGNSIDLPRHRCRMTVLNGKGAILWQRDVCAERILLNRARQVLALGSPGSSGLTAAELNTPNGHGVWHTPVLGLMKGSRAFVGNSHLFYIPIMGHDTPYVGLNLLGARGTVLRNSPIRLFTSALAPNGRLYGMGVANGHLYSLDRHLHLLWQRALPLGVPVNEALSIGPNGEVYVADGQMVLAYDASGRMTWEANTASPAVGLATPANGTLIVLTEDRVMTYDQSGKPIWSWTGCNASCTSMVADGDGKVYVGAADGSLYVLSSLGIVLGVTHVHGGSHMEMALDGAGRLLVSDATAETYVFGGSAKRTAQQAQPTGEWVAAAPIPGLIED